MIKVGIDPTGTQFKKYYSNDIILIENYFSSNIFIDRFQDKKAKIITSISMFYDLPDPTQFMKDIKTILSIDGIWVTEQSYIGSMLEKKSFDTICHEHLEYYAFKQLEYMAKIVGLKILDVSLNECNGGSFRIFFTHSDNQTFKVNYSNINLLEEYETSLNLDSDLTYTLFNEECSIIRKYLCKILTDLKKLGKSIYIYGASSKGQTLLQYFNIDNKLITAVAERNTEKYGRRTPRTDIPIISEDEMRKAKPDFLLVLPWHFKDGFIVREKEYLDNGGQFIFPLPNIEIYTNKKKAFITGINGQIGTYLSKILLEKDYIVYGLLHSNTENLNPSINYIFGDLKDEELIKYIINILLPDEFYNLGGETDTLSSIQNPEETFDINSRIIFTICETIKKTNKPIKFFQANSAEIFKGSLTNSRLIVNEDSFDKMHPITPYSISKLSSYWTTVYYREKLNIYTCNGIIFTSESPYRHERYLSKKVINFVKDLNKDDILYVGNLNCYRDWIHAEDVANGIYLTMQQEIPTDYIIASGVSNSIRKLIELAFKKINILLEWRGEGILEEGYDKLTNRTYVKINEKYIRKFENNEDLVGDSSKLSAIGWNRKFNLEDIISDMFDN